MRIPLPVRFSLACVLALAGCRAASAQCYQFSSGSAASLSVDITNLPPPTITIISGITFYEYFLSGLAGNSVVLTLGQSTYSAAPPPLLTLTVDYDPSLNLTSLIISVSIDATTGPEATVELAGYGNLVPNGVLPAALPPISEWGVQAAMMTEVGGTYTNYTLTSITSCSSANQPDKALGSPCDTPGGCSAGDPLDIATGNLFEQVTDYETAGQNKLRYARSYNSTANTTNPSTFAKTLGVNWRSLYDRYLTIVSSTSVTAERADGQVLTFTSNGGVWTSDTDVDVTLTQAGSIWTLTDHNDTVETYTTVSASEAVLASIQARGGYTQTLTYNTSNQLASVTDTYNRSLSFTYSNGLLQTVTTPDTLVLTYGYNSSGVKPGVLDRLASITYSTNPATSQSYLYENSALPFVLTGIIDEDGNRFATWTYDSLGRGLTSQHGSGADLTTVSYDDTTGNRTVTNALGEQDIYQFATLQGVPKVTEIDRQASATTAAATSLFTYDANGYAASTTDWNGNLTTYVNDVHGDPTTINEAVGTPQARTTIIVYDPTFVHLPSTITTQGLTTGFVYDPNENPLSKTLTDTTTQTVPYQTNGQTRPWIYTWQNFLLASVKTPNGNLTQYGYDSTGALTSTTNALTQVTNITQHTGGGYPQIIVDPNIVTTTLAYNARLWLLTSTVSATGQPSFTTTNGYDPAGNLTSITLPDNSELTYGYDSAHRLVSITDLFDNITAYTLDALGDVTLTNLTNPKATVTRTHSDVFDALGRVLQDIGGVGQTTTYAYDSNGNALTITDPRTHVTQQTFDALNRLSTVIDPAPGGTTTTTYDQHNRVLTVTDPNSNVTTYVYDGFGDKIQTASPDTRTTVYHVDPDSNLTQSTNAAGATAKYTYDALDRVLTTTYPKDAAENVAYTYDQPDHGFGIGHLTSLTDAPGSLSRSYDDRGNMTNETRTAAAGVLATSYTYDPASRVSSIAYPSAALVSYTRDKMGRIVSIKAQASGAPHASAVVSSVAYEPFGPVQSLTYGNAVLERWGFDLDYRSTSLADTGTAPVQKLTYHYDPTNNVKTITDGVTAGNSQSFVYDTLNRLTSATGGYGSFGYTYDPVNNMLSQTQNTTRTTYVYAPGTNRLAKIKTGATTQTVTTTAAGDISGFSPAMNNVASLVYNQADRLATANSSTGQLAQYTYDAFGHRTLKVGSLTATTIYQYDQAGHLLEETAGPGATKVDYVYLADRPIATIQPSNGKTYFLHDDRLGTPQLATGASQVVQWTAAYQPYGYTSTGIGTIVQNLRLPGQEWDLETGLYHNGFRDYNATLGRYIESDPIGLAGGVNTYGYAGANPIRRIDMLGLAYELSYATLSGAQDTANWVIQWQLSEPAPSTGGWIIQQINGAGFSNGSFNAYLYWEAWYVPPGSKGAYFDQDTFNIPQTILDSGPGNDVATATATFYPGLTLPSGFQTSNPLTPQAGALSATTDYPILPTSNISNEVRRTSHYSWQ